MINDLHTYRVADHDSASGPRGFVRTLRRAVKRCWLDYETIMRPRFFCQNIGSCGSTYLIQLLRDNQIPDVFHEKKPDLEQHGVENYFGNHAEKRLVRLLRYTRHNVFLEANNRLFSMSKELHLAFPNAKFVHLFRDPRQAVRSAMSKPNVVSYLSKNLRLKTTISGPSSADPFEKFCHHWRNANQRIFDDLNWLSSETGVEHFTLDFDDLIAGRVGAFEEFIGIELKTRVRAAVNQRPNRAEGRFPPAEAWSSRQSQRVQDICVPLWDELKRRAVADASR
ncbi:MAG: sulfotransferase [Planctomycetota bacterium]